MAAGDTAASRHQVTPSAATAGNGAAPPRRRGRPPGIPNPGTGRPKGSLGKKRLATIEQQAADPGSELAFLESVWRGGRCVIPDPADQSKPILAFPTLGERIKAAEISLDRKIPRLRATAVQLGSGDPAGDAPTRRART